jgi:hypothetical protein
VVKNIIELLNKLLVEENKEVVIKSLRDCVFNNTGFSTLDEQIQDILYELVYDLDFYQPDPAKRSEDPSFFDDEKLIEYTSSVIKKLREIDSFRSAKK